MRALVIANLCLGALFATPAAAQLTTEAGDSAANDEASNVDAVPGVLRVAGGGDLNPGLALNITAGYGYTEDVLGLSDTHHRMRASAAGTFRPTPWLAAGLRLDGRYDRHAGDMVASDDGWVGEARLLVLASKRINEQFGLGGQLTGWIPGIDGLSVDARAVGSVYLTPARLHANLGFRLDRSANSVDDVESLSQFDRLALGVSDSNAVLVGLGGEIPLASLEVLVEATWDVLVGSDAPSVIESPIRIGAGVRIAVTAQHRVAAMLEASVGRAPFVAANQPLVPVDPLIGIHIVISQRPKSTASLSLEPVIEPVVEKPGRPPDPDRDTPLTPRKGLAGLRGIVRDKSGEPIAGALVVVATRELLSDANGTFSAQDLMPGDIVIEVGATGFNKALEKVVLVADRVRDINVILEPQENASLVGAVQTFDGKPAAALVRIEPGGHVTASDDSGRFEIKLPAGTYTITAELEGWSARPMNVVLKVPGPVVIVNIDLRKR